MRDPKAEGGKEKTEGRKGGKKLAYSRSCSGHSNPQSEAAPLCSWMVCSSSDSEGRSLKVLSSRPGASREKRRTRWGRGVAASGSAVLAEVQSWWGPSAPVESVTAGFCEMLPLFWLVSASPRPAQKQQGSSMGLGLHGTQQTSEAQWALLRRPYPLLLQQSTAQPTFYKWTWMNLTWFTEGWTCSINSQLIFVLVLLSSGHNFWAIGWGAHNCQHNLTREPSTRVLKGACV